MTVVSISPLFYMQIFALMIGLQASAGTYPSIEPSPSITRKSFRLESSQCFTVAPQFIGWNTEDSICYQTTSRNSPDSVSNFISIIKDTEIKNYVLADPEYIQTMSGGLQFPSISYKIIALNENRVSLGTLVVIFNSRMDLENGLVYYLSGITPEGHVFSTTRFAKQ